MSESMKLGFGDYVRAAFNARPIGMFVSPNWIGLGLFGLLGILNPGFWLIGAGLELGYLGLLATNPRFQRTVAASRLARNESDWEARINSLIKQLGEADQGRYRLFEHRCRSILEQQSPGSLSDLGLETQGQGLGRLTWIFLRLLLTRQAIQRIVRESEGPEEDSARLPDRIGKLEERLKEESLSEELRRSLSSQSEILRQRLERRGEARDKLAFLDAELTRIQEQVELIREQAILSADPQGISERIDQISTTLGGTTQWISEQQQIYGAMEDLLAEPPPITTSSARKESQ
jgi:hypothetical protein